MTVIQSVRGPVDVADLGPTLMHEHVFIVDEEYRSNYVPDWDEDARVQDAARQLTELKGRGINTIVDPTVLGLGRNIPRVKRVNELVDINIIVATGVYTYDKVPHEFRFTGPGLLFESEEPLTQAFITDIEKGIADTGVRAAFLKCAIDEPGLTNDVERVMRAVGQASVQTGAPITVHTHAHSRSGLVAQRVLKEEGVDLSKVVIGHSGDSDDLDYLCELADAGSLLGMDRCGADFTTPFDVRVDTVAQMVRRGYAGSMVLSHDYACCFFMMPADRIHEAMPNFSLTHISDDVLPALRARGVSDEDIETMLVANPRKHFA